MTGDIAPDDVPSVDAVHALYSRWGADTYDEELSQLDHALQTAALAGAAGASDELLVAALLHDIGHLLALEGQARGGSPRPAVAELPEIDLVHEAVGARYLARLYPPAVTAPIALHVRAKRYRCTVDGGYHEGLSTGSKRSLEKQGGRMSDDEVAAFEALPGFADAVDLRGWDDGGKIDGLDVPGWDHYASALHRIAVPARP